MDNSILSGKGEKPGKKTKVVQLTAKSKGRKPKAAPAKGKLKAAKG